MKQVILKKGKAVVEDIPAPFVESGTVLVAVENSCISIGTEMSSLKNSSMPLWKRAMKQPENVKKAMEMLKAQGLAKTMSVVNGRIEAGNASGYSVAGTVIEVGEGVSEFRVGDKVACAGAQCAHHAAVVCVPKNLTVSVPEGLSSQVASTVTLGAIALQGVRRAQPTLGENFVVIGLGILGQITAQLLKANGCRVIGLDLDSARIDLAKKLGMDLGIYPDESLPIEQVVRLTDGYGADGVIVTAASPSDAIMSQSFQMCRKKGRVILVGDVGLDLNRADFYQKELDFFISTSYGPGRYDTHYEEEGMDYPIGYVRWTENRNMSEYLRLAAEGRLQIEPLIHSEFPVEQAEQAYASLEGKDKPLMVLLSYPQGVEKGELLGRTIQHDRISKGALAQPKVLKSTKEKLQVALIGAGGFAKGMHLPNLQSLSNAFELHTVASRTGHNAVATAKQFNAACSTTDIEEVFANPKVDLVIICTRHDLHMSQALRALKAGKHVLLEKPLALTKAELDQLVEFYEGDKVGDKPILLTGFNRRFSPYVQDIKKSLQGRSNPIIMNYRMNAGYIPLDHWVHGPEGGGRNRGEACHIYDLFTFLTDSEVENIQAHSLVPKTQHYSSKDNFMVTLSFKDGSLAHLTYTAMGAKAFAKEHLEVYFDGKVAHMEDYKNLKYYGIKASGLETKLPEKGQKEELKALAQAISKGESWPIPLWQQIQATEIAIEVDRLLI